MAASASRARFFGALSAALAIAVFALVGCDIDGETFSISVVNDTSGPISVFSCDDAKCISLDEIRTLNQGDSLDTTGVVGIPRTYLVKTADGETLGCVGWNVAARPRERRTYASNAAACSLE